MFSHTTTHVDVPKVEKDGSEISLDLVTDLVDMRIEQSIQLPDVATLRFNDPKFTHLDAKEFEIGSTLDVTLTDGEDITHLVFAGEITAIATESGTNEKVELVITALDRGHRLARSVRVHTYTAMTDADMVSFIASDHSLTPNVDSAAITHEYVLQAETDYAFLSRRAAALGFRWWIDGSTLCFKDVESPDEMATLTQGDNLLSFKVRMSSSDSASAVEVRAWDAESQAAIIGTSTPEATRSEGLASDAPAAADVATKSASFGTAQRFATQTLPDAVAADALATSIGRRAVSSQVRLRGVAAGDPRLAPGEAVELAEIGSQLSGVYTLTKVEHVLAGDGPYRTRFVCEGIDPTDLVELLRTTPDMGSRPTAGLVVGKVTAINDDAQPGRIKVQLPTLSDEDESAWARLAAPGAGNQRGLQVMPEIHDEVIVGFEQGDPLRPVILGGLWSTPNPPPLDNATAVVNDKVTVRAFHSFNGHRVEIKDDQSGGNDNSITIELAGGKGLIEVTEAGGVSITTPQDVKITADGDIALKATGDLSLAGANIKLAADSELTLEGVNIEAKATAKFAVEGLSVEAKGSASLNLEAGGVAQVKGAMVQLN